MNTIQDQWHGFKEATIPSYASEFQVLEMKKAFYAGAYALIGILLYTIDQDTSDEAVFYIFKNLRLETLEFFKGVSNDD